jgi:hypothetical protein
MVPSSSFGRRHRFVREPANFLTFLSSIRISRVGPSRRGQCGKDLDNAESNSKLFIGFCAVWLRHSFAIALGEAAILNDGKIRAYLGD